MEMRKTRSRSGRQSAAILWQKGPVMGTVKTVNGGPATLKPVGKGTIKGNRFAFTSGGPARLEFTLADARILPGAHPTMVSVESSAGAFTFFLRDVDSDFPIFIPEYGVAVTDADDKRDYEAIAADIRKKGLHGGIERYASEPEETFENACARNRELKCPTWLGLSRDMRMFRVGYSAEHGYWGYIQPAYHSVVQSIPETEGKTYSLNFAVGPGASCRVRITRRLEDGVLPILRSEQKEDDITYHLTAFVTLETQPLAPARVQGSDWRAVYPNTGGHMLSAAEIEKIKPLLETEMRGREEETVCCVRVVAVNTGRTPRYAWFQALNIPAVAPGSSFDGCKGFSVLKSGRVCGLNRLQGRPMPQQEMAVLIRPGERVVFEMLAPHHPLPPKRAEKLAGLDFDEHLEACRRFWRAKLATAASVSVPEQAVDERIRAGLLHCDLVALGKEPAGHLLATIGWYSPIGSESAPIIQFFDSMGLHKTAERALNFFLARQRPDGFIQNFGGYQLETGPALWTMGEHFRYTRDENWVRRIKPKLLKACEFLLAWRARNMKKKLKDHGYGLLDGKVADPEDFFRSFMLNGLSYLGIQRVSEMLKRSDPRQAARLAKEARAFRADIRKAFARAMADSPVVPLGDGTWAPSFPPWCGYHGPVSLYADGGNWFTHGAFGARDSLIGALYLVISDVLEPNETATSFMLKTHHELFTVENAGLSQPYYCRHDYIHLRRGEVNAFLKTYYNQFAALQDRETYTFWEHYFHASQHKTHEEGWFLMQTRWMLWLEEGDCLKLLAAVPRAWLEDGKKIELKNVATYFGPVSLQVESQLSRSRITAVVECRGNRRPRCVEVRLPHPEGCRASGAIGAVYDAATETARVQRFTGRAEITLQFN